MTAGMIYGYVAASIVGILCIASGIFNWDFLMSSRAAWMPKTMKRIFYILFGILILGAMGTRYLGMW